MPKVSFDSLAVVLSVAFLVPLLLGFVPRLRVPAVVVEIVAGIVVGPQVLDWARADEPVQILALVGLVIPVLREGNVSENGAVAAGLLQPTSLPFIVAATQIGVVIGAVTAATAAAFVAAGLVSALLFPVVALALTRRKLATGAKPLAGADPDM